MRRAVLLASPLLLLLCLPLLGSAAVGEPEPPLVLGASVRVLDAYRRWSSTCDGLRWELLAGIGWVESAHGTTGGASVDDETGAVRPPIFGPELDGSSDSVALPIGDWRGRWGLTGRWQRALGPMQLLPGTFAAWAVDGDGDGDGDGIVDPHDIDDAVATAASYLCGGETRIDDERRALLRYNHSENYVEEVLRYADDLTRGQLVVGDGWLCPVAGPVSFVDTWLAPRSGGRLHQGVDMFAARETPIVAPVGGDASHFHDSLGGLSFRLWGDDGAYYYGTHLSRFGARTGSVPAGTVLGYVGDSGNAAGTGNHLHFEIHPGRRRVDAARAVNPTPTVSVACAMTRIGVGSTAGA